MNLPLSTDLGNGTRSSAFRQHWGSEMPHGSRHEEMGWLNESAGQLLLRRDEGGRWRLDVGLWLGWRTRKLIGKRVRITGRRSGFDLLDVTSIEAI